MRNFDNLTILLGVQDMGDFDENILKIAVAAFSYVILSSAVERNDKKNFIELNEIAEEYKKCKNLPNMKEAEKKLGNAKIAVFLAKKTL